MINAIYESGFPGREKRSIELASPDGSTFVYTRFYPGIGSLTLFPKKCGIKLNNIETIKLHIPA
jgi:precorrin-6B methylase 1